MMNETIYVGGNVLSFSFELGKIARNARLDSARVKWNSFAFTVTRFSILAASSSRGRRNKVERMRRERVPSKRHRERFHVPLHVPPPLIFTIHETQLLIKHSVRWIHWFVIVCAIRLAPRIAREN